MTTIIGRTDRNLEKRRALILSRAKWLYREERGEIWDIETADHAQFLDRAERQLLNEGSIEQEAGAL